MTTTLWNEALVDQIDFHWKAQLRPRLEGLTDEEYLWEPAPGAWGVRPQPDGTVGIDFTFPEPDPPPVTTIGWRLGHILVGVLAMRVASHFGGPEASYQSWPWAATADAALAQLDEQYDAWLAGVRGLGEEGLLRPCGPAEGPFGHEPMAVLVLHIHRELLHHGAEICLLRDLYRALPEEQR